MRPIAWVFLWLALGSPTGASAQCEVRGEHVTGSRVIVATPGVVPFAVELRGAAASASLASRGDHHVRVSGTLAFVGEAQDEHLPIALSRVAHASRGMIQLATSVVLSDVHADASGARAAVDLGDVRFRRLWLPCAALTLDARGAVVESVESATGDGTYWVPRSRSLRLHATPGREPSIEAILPIPEFVTLVREARRGEWSRVRWQSGTGSSMSGWVQQRLLAPMPGGDRAGSYGQGSGSFCQREPEASEASYRGPARIRRDARVHDRPDGVAWASATTNDAVEVVHEPGARWVRIRSLPDLTEGCARLLHTWVAVADVTFPAAPATSPLDQAPQRGHAPAR